VFRRSDKPLEEKEYPDEADLAEAEDEDEGAVRLVKCPACGELIHDQTQQCPHCKEWVVLGGQTWRDSRKWYVRGGLYLTRTLLLNWLFWLALMAIAGIVAILSLMENGK
jgi:hypothetical protein